ncbi:YD repeat protein [Cellulomonas flavigena DSM 20109]|uniref:YD repeat protein n=1 Tax=Cellulomonas flavigena (strain ATCC 482 / DSM 20109 / BCRC 11376 / JCM 18109 / NBRC 3775 / NCIMB 8073 / NRS 134) TaxID=446466 RepID=D5UCR7_CELFN|nr:DNRLRE domain-containing protein [Cellulomonas flavigena]ADG76302.1 YD repeat protein [Cellulomonas flavigena DSM 20109]
MPGLLPSFGVPESWRRRVPLTALVVAATLLGTGLAPAQGAPAPPVEPEAPEATAPVDGETLTAPDAVSAATIARLEGVPVEVLGERTADGSVFAMPDGTWAAGRSSGPVWVRTGGDGTAEDDWAAVDPTLEAADDGTLRPVAHPADVVVSGAVTEPDGLVDVVTLTTEDGTTSTITWDGPLPAPRVEGARVVYEDVRPSTDMVVDVTAAGVEQFFVLHEAPAEPEELALPVTIDVDGGEAVQLEDGSLEVRGPEGEVAVRGPQPMMWDATADADRVHPVTEPWQPLDVDVRRTPPAWLVDDEAKDAPAKAPKNAPAGKGPKAAAPAADLPHLDGDAPEAPQQPVMADQVEVEREVEVADGQVRIDLQPQAEFLTDPATVYPVVVDPELALNGGFDTYVQSNSSANLSTSTELLMGTWNGGSTVARSFVNFSIPPVHGKKVLDAHFVIYEHHAYSCQARNWQVWDTTPASDGTRWSAQPAWMGHYSTSSETRGYSSACPDGDVRANISALVQRWADAPSVSTVGVGLKAENEADSYGWKRFYSAESGAGPWVWVSYNSVPNVPTNLNVSPRSATAYNGVYWTNTLTPRLSATVSDPDGENLDSNFYLFRGAGAHVWGWGNGRASGFVTSGTQAVKDVPAGTLVDQETYFFMVAGSDWKHEGSPSARFTFGVDTVAPTAPVVTSSDYPDDNKWRRAPGDEGTFTITPSQADGSIVEYRWALDKAPDPNQKVAAVGGTTQSLKVKPTTAGRHVLQVQAVDRAGNVSPVRKYAFNVGLAGIVAPDEGTRVVRRVPIRVQAADGYRYVRYEWRRGPDSTDTYAVPLGDLTTSTGRAWTSTWQALPTGNAYTTWDAGTTLGHEGGPVQVRAQVSKSADGSSPQATQWVTLTVDPDADGAASAEVGPGSVNLLTGDHTLSVTDVDEFGISVVRTASSRETRAGIQLHGDRLPEAIREGNVATDIAQHSAAVTIDTQRFHAGTSSFKVTSKGAADSYASIYGDTGPIANNKLGLQAGRTYRISAWVYVPAATGLKPDSARGLGINVFWRVGTGAYSEPAGTAARTPMPTKTDRWQRVTTDVTIPAGATEAFARFYNGFAATNKPVYFDNVSIRETWSPFGKEWSLGTVDEWAGTAYTHVSRPYDEVAAVHLTGGGQIWFTSGDGQKWFPEPGAESLTLKPEGNGWRLTELDGTYSLFTRPGSSGDYFLKETSSTVADTEAQYVYETSTTGPGRLVRIIAPREPGVTGCTAATPAAGCKVLELEYATSTTAVGSSAGDYAGQVKAVHLWSADPGVASTRTTVARYAYDVSGRLEHVNDPRLARPLVTRYEYDSSGRVTIVKPAGEGEEPYRFTYGQGGAQKTGAGDWIDAGARLLKVTRASLVQGTTSTRGPDNTTTVVYNVPLTRGAGGPYDMNAAAIDTWAQQDGPTDGTAVFPPQVVPSVTTATATQPGKDGYGSATVHYLNASGLEVNTASPNAADGPVEGLVDTTEYDGKGRVVRTLDATNRLLALGKLPESAELGEWGITGTPAAIAQMLDTRTFYTADDLAVHATRGPAQRLAVGNDPDQQVTGHAAVRYAHDEGRPATVVASKLPTRERSGTIALGADVVTADFLDSTLTTYGYSPVDPAVAPTHPSSGWIHKQPTSVTVDAEGPEPLRATTVYDDRGRPIRSSKPGSTGADAGTTLSILYTAGTNAADAACGNRPEWAGQPCVTRYAGAVTGHDASRMPGQLSEKRVTEYNRFGTATLTTETANGQTRQTRTTVDAADRVTAVEISGSAGAGAAIARTTTTYDPLTGDVTRNASVDAAGNVVAAVRKEYDAFGRLVRYTDAHGGWTATEYDRYGQPVKVTDSIGTTRTYEYDRTVDPRGYVTLMTDSVAGEVRPVWGPDGQLKHQFLPGGVAMSVRYDAARVPVARTYTDSQGVVIWHDSVVENHRGQWVEHTSWTGTRTYEYDRYARLVGVNEAQFAGAECTTRRYGYDQRSNRVSFATATGGWREPCPGADIPATTTSTYDSASRLVSTSGGNGDAWRYDAFGRTTAMPTADGSGVASTSYFVNDLVASQEVPGVQKAVWTLDPLQRFSTQETFASVSGAWASSATQVIHYDGDGDEPGWVVEDATQPDKVTRWVEGADGQVAVQTGRTGEQVLQLVDLHGDVVGTVPIHDGAPLPSWQELSYVSYDEFGNPQPLSGGASSNAPPRYGWLGAAQRSADTPTGVVLMGVRLYHPGIGRFLQVDPVAGGSANAYDYCNADPVNCTDLGGTIAWGKVLGAVATIGEIASFIPGPIGAAAAGISAVAYAASGNKGKALEMGITAAAQLVGAGIGVRAAFKATSISAKVTQRAQAAASRVRSALKRGCSFVAGTLVRMADGSLRPIEDLQVGDLILAGNPETGETSPEPVITPLVSTGDKRLIALRFDGDVQAVVATDNHPYWVQDQGWVAAGDLLVGDTTVASDGSERVLVQIGDLGVFANQTVHNLHVAGQHTYYVTADEQQADQLVHNAGPAACDIAEGALRKHVKGTNEHRVASAADRRGKSVFFGLASARTIVAMAVRRGTPIGKSGRKIWRAPVVVGVTAGGRMTRTVIVQSSKRGWHGFPY